MPHELISSIIHKFFPNLERRIKRTVTVPVVRTLTSHHVESGQQAIGSRPVAYITFDALVGRNSTFHDLTHEQIEELCGVEFKALNCLVWIVPCVRFRPVRSPPTLITSRVPVLLDHPGHLVHYHCVIYVSSEVETKFCSSKPAFQSLTSMVRAPRQFEEPRLTLLSRFSLFQVVSAYTNTGTSLVDQSMVPFQRAYPVIVTLIFLIVAGNTGFVSYPIRSPGASS